MLGLAVAAFIVLTAFFCSRHLRQKNAKKHVEPTIYQPKRRPVRSPSSQPGQPPHYLKKSPSPTSITKPLPGSQQSPNDQNGHASTAVGQVTLTTPPNGKPQSISIAQSKYAEENETQHKAAVSVTKYTDQMDSSVHSNGSDSNDTREYGKLGSLVFKLRYMEDCNALVVSVIRCRGLPYKNSDENFTNGLNGKTHTATDPYVKLQLLPEKQHKVKTR